MDVMLAKYLKQIEENQTKTNKLLEGIGAELVLHRQKRHASILLETDNGV